MTNEEISELFLPVLADLDDFDYLSNKKPQLAHYTSIEVLENILKTEQFWLSSPLLMNDLEEMRFGLHQGIELFGQSTEIDACCGSPQRAHVFRQCFWGYVNQFDTSHALEVYVACFSEYDPKKPDGLLSMWRAYGNHGNGAALVFSTNLLKKRDDAPLIIAKVKYGSVDSRILWLKKKIGEFGPVLKASNIPDDRLYIAANSLFHLIKIYALTSKHSGFDEEKEWRIIYLPDRDPHGALKRNISYFVGARGPEPKLKLPIKPVVSGETWTFSDILDKIILGPSLTSPLARIAVEIMLAENQKDDLRDRLLVSAIPLRPV